MIKNYAIISKDRHREDYVYLFTGTSDGAVDMCEKIWKQDFNSPYDYRWVSGGGSYEVCFVEIKKLKQNERKEM